MADNQPRARPAPSATRRRLPHLQNERRTYFVTFTTVHRLKLTEDERDIVLEHCLHDHGKKLHMHAAVVMPDHVHLLFTPMVDGDGNTFGLAEIMRAIKGVSARTINRGRGRTGALWQDESFDRMLRRDESIREKAEYICANPDRAGLALPYRWLWREWVEGIQTQSPET